MGKKTGSFDPNAAAAAGSGIYGLPCGLEQSRVVLLPVPFEATTSSGGGTSKGPVAIFDASMQVDLYDEATGKPYEVGIHMLKASPRIRELNRHAKRLARAIIERGGNVGTSTKLRQALNEVNAAGSAINLFVQRQTTKLLVRGKIVGVIGGDHSVPFGAIKAHADRYPGLGILHIDAHADLRDAFEGFTWSHASIMRNVMTAIPGVAKLVQVGIRDFCEEEVAFAKKNGKRICQFTDHELAGAVAEGTTWWVNCRQIAQSLPQEVYISFDIDGLDPTLCPNTGTPVPGGLSFNQIATLLDVIVEMGHHIVGFDLCEVAPPKKGVVSIDANVGARLLYKLIGYTLLSRRK